MPEVGCKLILGIAPRRAPGLGSEAFQPEGIEVSLIDRVQALVLASGDRMVGLDLNEIAVDGRTIMALSGGEVARRNPVDRGNRAGNAAPPAMLPGSRSAPSPPQLTGPIPLCWNRRSSRSRSSARSLAR